MKRASSHGLLLRLGSLCPRPAEEGVAGARSMAVLAAEVIRTRPKPALGSRHEIELLLHLRRPLPLLLSVGNPTSLLSPPTI